MKNFFIVGLPRSRTAWLANFLTNGDANCSHEALRKLSDVSELPHFLNPSIVMPLFQYSYIGDSDAGLLPHLARVREMFPAAKWVFIVRNTVAAVKSYRMAFPQLEADLQHFDILDKFLHDGIRDTPGALVVRYEDLGTADYCAKIHEFCLGRPMNFLRWQLVKELRITTDVERAAPQMAPTVRMRLEKAVYESQLHKEFNTLLEKMCGANREAFVFLMWLWETALTWDHLEDGDPVDKARLNRTFEGMLLQLPFNNFWRNNAMLLAPVMSNAIAAWRAGPRIKEYDVYTETACAVAFCLGGAPLVKEYSPKIRELGIKLMEENDAKGQGERSPIPDDERVDIRTGPKLSAAESL